MKVMYYLGSAELFSVHRQRVADVGPHSDDNDEKPAQVRKSVDSPPGMLTEDHHHTVHEERQVCYSSHLRPKPLHL